MTVRTLVIGLGNSSRGDDAAGLVAAERLAQSGRSGVTVATCEGEPFSLLDRWREGDRVILIDATSTRSRPGTLRRFDAHRRPLPAGLFATSTHALGLAALLELARRLDRMPDELIVYGLEGASFGLGDALSPAAEAAVAEVVACVRIDLGVEEGEPCTNWPSHATW